MSYDPVRISPLNPSEFTPEQKELVGDWDVLNFSRVLVQHPALYRVIVPLVEKVISFTDLPPWDREVIVIRTLAQCSETYEMSHHLDIARDKVGMSGEQIEAIITNRDGLSESERWLVKATDELIQQFHMGDESWAALAKQYSTIQLMEVVGLVGCYTTMAMLTRSFGIRPEARSEIAAELARLRGYD